jgi:hypothetical protein
VIDSACAAPTETSQPSLSPPVSPPAMLISTASSGSVETSGSLILAAPS